MIIYDQENTTRLNFEGVSRKKFTRNYLTSVVVQLGFPTLLRLKHEEPVAISEDIRSKFPIYDQQKRMQMSHLGASDPQPVYLFHDRYKRFTVELTSSSLVLSTNAYTSFEDLIEHVDFLIENCVIKHLDTTFFTSVGLRYVNNITGMERRGRDVYEWVNKDLVTPAGLPEIQNISSMKNEMRGNVLENCNFGFRYGIGDVNQAGERSFILDWDYLVEGLSVDACRSKLGEFHKIHFPFFWWALGANSRAYLEGDANAT